jgi:hypothetical protein
MTAPSAVRLGALASTALLAAGALAGCGSGSSAVAQDPGGGSSHGPTGATTPAAPSGPRCEAVWKSGATLPSPYHGCTSTAGWVRAQNYQCENGQRLVTYAHAFYATPGRSISRAATTLAKDHEFRHTMAVCGA